jgi:hypothetical protein
MRTLRNLAHRRLRTALTVSGITIGIWHDSLMRDGCIVSHGRDAAPTQAVR